MWLRILGLAACYFVAGKLSLLMAIPPGYATAFWPAAGMAVAGLLLFGNRVWPGVMLGSFLVNVATEFDARNAGSVMVSLALPALIGAGAALQAWAGAALVRRFVGFTNRLNREKDIALLLLLAGPVSCCVNATVGVASLRLLNRAPIDAAFTWWVWWIGDTIGVFVVAPVALLWAAQPLRIGTRRPITVSVPLLILGSIVVALFVNADAREKDRVRSEFQFRTEILGRALENRIGYVLHGLNRVHSFHGDQPNEADRRKFAKATRNLLKQRSSVDALTWAPRIRAADRPDFERTGKLVIQEQRDGVLAPAQARPEYFPILYREPGDPKDFGFDVASETDWRDALERACHSGEPAASTPVVHRKETDKKSVLVFLPIFRDNVVPVVSADRPGAILGYVIAVVHLDRMIEVAWRDFQSAGIDFWLFDESAPSEKRFAFYRGAERGTVQPATPGKDDTTAADPISRTMQIEAVGRQWKVHFAQTPEYLAAHRSLQAWLVLGGGMLCTGLLGAVLLVVTGRADLVAGLVEARTAELAQANAAMKLEIEERKRAQAALDEARRFVQRVAEMTPSKLYVYDLKQQCNIFVNRRLESFLGYAWGEKLAPKMPTLLSDIHPDDLPKVEWANEQCQTADDGAVIDSEYRIRHANGEWRWLNCRNTVFVRDRDGNPTQILGAAQDITDRKRLEEEVLEIAASEQRRIGQELHDGTGQELTGLCMLADSLADALKDAAVAEAQTARRIAQGLKQALGQVRLLSRGLIPVEVDAEGLMAALTELARRISDLHTVRCSFDYAEPVLVEDNHTATQLYRIAQEAITNALKHGQAAILRVSLEVRGHYITLKIADDGVGIPEIDEVQEGMGLRIMRYRAGQIGAHFTVRPGLTRGTVVTCTLYRGAIP